MNFLVLTPYATGAVTLSKCLPTETEGGKREKEPWRDDQVQGNMYWGRDLETDSEYSRCYGIGG
jgi:hypothetical protein